MPEAYSECQEILAEIRRLRREWLRAEPIIPQFKQHRYDWTRKKGGRWDRARDEADAERRRLHELGDDELLQRARCIARAARAMILERRRPGWSEKIPPGKIKIPYDEFLRRYLQAGEDGQTIEQIEAAVKDLEGWRGDEIEAWRVMAWYDTTAALKTYDHPYRDWLEAYVDFDFPPRIVKSSWTQFWFYEVAESAMPRFWLRWAFEYLQMFRKVTPGTPCDTALATYLPEADFVVSADRTFIDLSKRVAAFARFPIAKGQLIESGTKGIECLSEIFSQL